MTNNAITTTDQDRQLLVGAAADQFARHGVFSDYQMRRAHNTLRRQQDDLATFIFVPSRKKRNGPEHPAHNPELQCPS